MFRFMGSTDHRHFTRGWRAAALLLDGSFAADVLLAGDDTLPEPVRLEAHRRLADRFPWPIHPGRWPPCNEALGRLAPTLAERDALLRERVLATVAELVPAFARALAPEMFGAPVAPLLTRKNAQPAFRTCLGSVVEADVLGDASLFEVGETEPLDAMDDLALSGPALDAVTGWIAAVRSHTTSSKECELLDLLDRYPMATAEEAAATLGCKPVTIRVMCSNLKRKSKLARA